jgi:hypothetical protein
LSLPLDKPLAFTWHLPFEPALKLATLWFESSDLRNAVESVWTALLQQSSQFQCFRLCFCNKLNHTNSNHVTAIHNVT